MGDGLNGCRKGFSGPPGRKYPYATQTVLMLTNSRIPKGANSLP